MNITPKLEAFISHFGEMGSRWGISRTVGQIYALLMVTEKPLNADEIVEVLGISRSNASMGIKELQSWRIIKHVHYQGDRKEYYSTPEDTWEIARTIFEERKKRELEPTLSMLRLEMMREPVSDEGRYAHKKMGEIHDLMETMTNWADELQRLSSADLATLMKLGSSVTKVLKVKDKLIGKKAD